MLQTSFFTPFSTILKRKCNTFYLFILFWAIPAKNIRLYLYKACQPLLKLIQVQNFDLFKLYERCLVAWWSSFNDYFSDWDKQFSKFRLNTFSHFIYLVLHQWHLLFQEARVGIQIYPWYALLLFMHISLTHWSLKLPTKIFVALRRIASVSRLGSQV